MGVPFETFLPYVIMVTMFGVTVRAFTPTSKNMED